MITSQHWQQRVGSQRDWVWRGWQTRYTFIRPNQPQQKTTPMILLHGFGTSIGHWRQNLSVLGEYHTVYALDMLGFGASEKAPVNYKVELWVEQVYEFWRTFIRQPVVLVGNSIGSLVAIAAAAKHPEMVGAIAMLSLPDPSLEVEAIPKFLRPAVTTIKSLILSPVVLKTLFRWARTPSGARRWATLAYVNKSAITDELLEILVAPAEDRGSAQAFYATFKAASSAVPGFSVKTVLPNLEIPILLIWGQQDKMVPPAFARQFAAYNPKVELLVLENAGHCPHDECPEEVNQAILAWIDNFLSRNNSPEG